MIAFWDFLENLKKIVSVVFEKRIFGFSKKFQNAMII